MKNLRILLLVCAAASPAQENALCTTSGQSNGCGICDSFK